MQWTLDCRHCVVNDINDANNDNSVRVSVQPYGCNIISRGSKGHRQ